MKLSTEICSKIAVVIENLKTVNISLGKDELTNVFHTINEINSLGLYKQTVGNYDLAEYRIPTDFGALIEPKVVRLEAVDQAIDLKSSAATDLKGTVLDPNAFNMTWSKICGLKKVNNPSYSNISELRTAKLITEVADKLTDNTGSKCQASTVYYVPIQVGTAYYSDYVYTIDCNTMVERWFTRVYSDLRHGNAK